MKTALPPIVYPDSRILILGTMPGEQSLARQQYYANRGNHFWKLLFAVFGLPFTDDYEARKKLLHRKRIALWDVLAGCYREGSLDANIKNESANDFDTFFKNHPTIKTVFFSSKAAAAFYDKYAGQKIGIAYHILPSPSGANASMKFSQKLDVWKSIADAV